MPDEIVEGILAKRFDRDGVGAEASIQRFRRDALFFFDASDVNAWRVAAEILVVF